MKKSVLYILTVCTLLTFSFVCQSATAVSEIEETINFVEKNKLDGWVTEKNITYYYQKGKKVTGPFIVDNEHYFFDLTTGAKMTGLINYQGKNYFYDQETGIQKRGFVTWMNNVYFFGKNGNAQRGIRRINGQRYCFDSNGVMLKNALIRRKYYAGPEGAFVSGWVNIGIHKYYFDLNSYKMVKGWKFIDGKMYYFDQNGIQQKLTGKYKVAKGEHYYFDPVNGEMKTGWVTINENTFYFSPATGRAVKRWQMIDGKKYFFDNRFILQKNRFVKKVFYVDENGARVYGWREIDKKMYYFKTTNGRLLKPGWREIDGKKYYVLSDGSIAFSTWYNDTQYIDEYGSLAKGWKEIDGKTYYFQKKSGNYQTGWKRIEGIIYYFDENGVKQTLSGLQVTDKGKQYYFDPLTNQPVSGWVTMGEDTYYFSLKSQRSFKKWHIIDGDKYYFNEEGKLVRNQFVNERYYVNELGRRVYGWQTLNEKVFYFNEKTGRLSAEGWRKIGEQHYYVMNDRSIAFSTWINADQYVDENGSLVSGWYVDTNGSHYFEPEKRILCRGWKEIDDKKYYFDETTGIMQTSVWIDQCYLGADGVMAKDTWVGAYYVDFNGKQTGKTRTPGLFTENNNTYFLSENFEKLTGWQTVDDNTYYFNKETGIMEKSKWIEGYYLDANGLRTSAEWTTIDGVNYLFLENGKKATGLIDYNGKKYYFSTVTGAQQYGFRVLDDKTHYFNSANGGAMAINETITINGIPYDFDENGHMSANINTTADEKLGQEIAAYAQSFIGYPYVYGGEEDLTKGVDCSAFTMLVMRHFGIKIPRNTWMQHDGVAGYKKPMYVAVEDLKPGDLIFYYAGNSHVAMYIGNGKMVHASNERPYPEGGIKISNYNYTYIYGCVRYWY